MKHLTFLRLGYMSSDESIYNFSFHHCINCLQPLANLAEYDSLSVSNKHSLEIKLWLWVWLLKIYPLVFLVGKTKSWQFLDKTFNMNVQGLLWPGLKEANQQTPWNSIPFYFGPEIFIITSSFTTLGPQQVIDIPNSLSSVWSTSSTSLVDTHVHLKSITITHTHSQLLNTLRIWNQPWNLKIPTLFHRKIKKSPNQQFFGGFRFRMSMFEFCFLKGVYIVGSAVRSSNFFACFSKRSVCRIAAASSKDLPENRKGTDHQVEKVTSGKFHKSWYIIGTLRIRFL